MQFLFTILAIIALLFVQLRADPAASPVGLAQTATAPTAPTRTGTAPTGSSSGSAPTTGR